MRSHRLTVALFLRNAPLLFGLIILLFLLLLVLAGPRFATENPYLSGMRATELIDGELATPPFPPSQQFPLGSDRWGRDLLSLLLYGARNTLVACLFVTMIRLFLGLILGGWAGWRAGGLGDRLIMGLVEILSSLPLLIVGMLLIYALDIRRGLVVFLIGLSFVGWGEIAQYVRSEFMTLREKPFVEGAHAVGLTGPQIVVRHLLPNILPQLVVLTLLEMGAVLMLFGELGFVGVFIGGGSETELLSGNAIIADVPEWGAILAGTRGFIRSAPFLLLYPSLAFAVSVFGFNALGEGLRRVIREAGLNTAALLSKWMALAGLAVALLTWLVLQQISPSVSYVALADRFDGERAVAQAQEVLGLQADALGFGTEGARQAAEYLAQQLAQYGAQPAAEIDSYLQPVVRQVTPRLHMPQVVLLDDAGQPIVSLQHGIDFGEQTYRHGGSGRVQGQLVYVGFAQPSLDYGDYRGLDLEGKVVLCTLADAPRAFDNEALIRGAQAVLYISDDVTPHCDLGTIPGLYMQTPGIPIVHITPAALDRLLVAEGIRLEKLTRVATEALAHDPSRLWVGIPLPQQVLVDVAFGEIEERTGYNVLAILPGNDIGMDEQSLMLSSHYDLPEPAPGQRLVAPGDGPAAAGLILETARLWHEQGFKPRRTVLLSLWAGGHFYETGADTYARETSPYKSLQRQATIRVGPIGDGSGGLGFVTGDEALRRLLMRSANTTGSTIQVNASDLSGLPYAGPGSAWVYQPTAPSAFQADLSDQGLDSQLVFQVGRVINVVMITASRQYHYE